MEMKELVEAIKAHSELENSQIIDAANYGADGGFGGFTWYTDTDEFYDKNKEAIWELLEEPAENMGCKNVMEMISQSGRSDMACTDEGFKCLCSWFALEEAGRWLEDNLDELEEDSEEDDEKDC